MSQLPTNAPHAIDIACDAIVEIAEVDVVRSTESADDGGDSQSDPQETNSRKPDPLFSLLLAIGAGLIVILSATLSIRSGTQVVVPILGKPLPELCYMRRYAGLDCPGCGLTRAFISIGHGRFAEAWRYNPAAMLIFPLIAAQVPIQLVQYTRARRGLPELRAPLITQVVLGIVITSLVAQWVLRQTGMM